MVYDSLSNRIAPEIKILFPSIKNIALTKIIRTDVNENRNDTLTVAILKYENFPSQTDTERFRDWLSARMGTTKLEIIQSR